MSDADADTDDGEPELGAEARERLADIVELQPTKNSALQERWDVESGSEVHQYLESELRDYYYRDENSLIRATAAGVALVRGEEVGETMTIHMSDLEEQVFAVAAGPDERSESVVSVLHKLHEEFGIDPESKAVRQALNSLERKGVVEVVYRTVPTFKLAVDRDRVEVADDEE
ncbi:DUF5797 family protein [Halospeciosus flavus]|uniref:DUF5797 family protein n=1 Tax=Halospeciosus flavus TaxID=3032283 RepID=A0ABD5Z557_9EURY|nr:DUF5797 family protein [Halospeciosus flavus]